MLTVFKAMGLLIYAAVLLMLGLAATALPAVAVWYLVTH